MTIALKYSMATKICSKCKIEKDVSCFYKNKRDGEISQCKACCKQYRIDNATRIAKQQKQYQKQYRKNNAIQLAKQQKKYYIDNKSRLSKHNRQYHKQYDKDNALRIAERKKQYYIDNKLKMTKRRNQYRKNNTLFKTYFKQLEQFEKIRKCPENLEWLEVKCAYCGKWMKPTNLQIQNRLQVFNGQMSGECRFYCSENCKQACPIYRQVKYPKGFKKTTSREVVPLLRQLVLKRDNYTCQKCGATTETAQLHVHHIVPYAQNKIQANDPDSCITLCKKCHKWVHSKEGCNYNNLKCPTKLE